MTTTTAAMTAPTPAGERTRLTQAPDAPVVPIRTRRRPALIGLGVSLVVLGTVGGAWLGTQLDNAEQVLVLAQDKQAGDVLTQADLRAAPLSSSSTDLRFIPLEDASRYEGQLLTGNVPAGTVLAPGMLAPEPATPTGTYIVGIPLTPGQMPAVGLRPGDEVFLVMGVTQINSAAAAPAVGGEEQTPTTAQELTEPGRAWSAEVVSVGRPSETDTTGATTIDVAIRRADAADVAAAAATRSMSVVLQPASTADTDVDGGEDR